MRSLAQLLVLGAALMTAAARPATAQEAAPRSGSQSGMSTATRADNINAYSAFSFFGRCFVSANRGRAYALIATQPGSDAERTWFRDMMSGEQNCLSGGDRTSASTIFFRGVIAEALGRNPSDLPAGLVLTAVVAEEVRSLPDVARCFVGGNREAATALLATSLGSTEETAAVTTLWPNFQSCMARAPRVRLNAPWIRFLIAEALLRMPQS